MSKPTPVPWEIERTSLVVVERSQCRAIKAACSSRLGDEFTAFCDGPNRDANAELICRAVNSHDELIAALELLHELAPHADWCPTMKGGYACACPLHEASKVLAKAKGNQ